MTSTAEPTRSHPVTAASRLLSRLSRHGLTEQVEERVATDIETIARFTIGQYTCHCPNGTPPELSHIVGDDCPPHPLHPQTER